MRNKVCFVTGGNTGIGLETARALARMGATVVLTSRNALKGQ
jgi:NAD(P)-dependent dehydrogenase (short-subunit alcohol dehydrogenase family)